MAGMFDVDKELARLGKQRLKIEKELAGVAAKLGNPKFVANAKPAIVEGIKKQVGPLAVISAVRCAVRILICCNCQAGHSEACAADATLQRA